MSDQPENVRPTEAQPPLALGSGSASSVEVLGDRELPWDEAMALHMAYELHRRIGCNIHHYRGPTAAGFLAVIRDAYKRTHAPLNTQGLVTPGTGQSPEEGATSRRHQ